MTKLLGHLRVFFVINFIVLMNRTKSYCERQVSKLWFMTSWVRKPESFGVAFRFIFLGKIFATAGDSVKIKMCGIYGWFRCCTASASTTPPKLCRRPEVPSTLHRDVTMQKNMAVQTNWRQRLKFEVSRLVRMLPQTEEPFRIRGLVNLLPPITTMQCSKICFVNFSVRLSAISVQNTSPHAVIVTELVIL